MSMFFTMNPRKALPKNVRDKEGKKLYPVGSWEKNQHKLYNAHTRLMNRIWELHDKAKWTTEDNELLSKLYDEQEKLEHLIGVFDFGREINGIVFARWEDYKLMKEYIASYDMRH